MSERKKWLEKARPCKLGTIPALVRLDGRSRLEVGRWVRVQEHENGKWAQVQVTRVDPDGYFMASR